MRLSIVVAASENNVIGASGGIPWRLRDDQLFFKNLTLNHCILMGRKTHESIGRLLPGRTTIILSQREAYSVPGAHVAYDLNAAEEIALALGEEELFVVGGEGIYALALPHAQRLYLTRVHTHMEGDVSLPAPLNLAEANFRCLKSEPHEKDERNEYAYTFETWERHQKD